MPDRKSLAFTLWLTSSLALLASVLTTPLPTSQATTVLSRTDGLVCDDGLSQGQLTTRLGLAIVTDAVPQVNAAPPENPELSENEGKAENEEQDQDQADAADEPHIAFRLPGSFHKVLDRRLTAPRPILSLYPLRC